MTTTASTTTKTTKKQQQQQQPTNNKKRKVTPSTPPKATVPKTPHFPWGVNAILDREFAAKAYAIIIFVFSAAAHTNHHLPHLPIKIYTSTYHHLKNKNRTIKCTASKGAQSPRMVGGKLSSSGGSGGVYQLYRSSPPFQIFFLHSQFYNFHRNS